MNITKTDYNEFIKLLRYSANKMAKEVNPLDYKTCDTIRRINKILRKHDNNSVTR